MTKPSVFISYSGRDAAWATAFAEWLKTFGLKVWIDRWNLVPGQEWPSAIEKALRESDVIAVVVNPAEPWRPDLFFEVGAAVSMEKRVVPILPKDYDHSQLPYPLRVRTWIEREGSPEETAEKLVAGMQRQ